MSLVEIALKKMQSGAAAAKSAITPRSAPAGQEPRGPSAVVGKVVERSSHFPLAEGESANASGKLVRIDPAALRSAGLVPPEHQQRMLADQYRHIKRPLVAAAIGRGVAKMPRGQIIMIASAMPGEGKTWTSINLALSMSLEKDISVLLVDADVAKPHISRTFGIDREPGVIDVLRDEKLNVESLILPTDVPNLSLLPAGQHSETATELLASHRMEATVNYLAESKPGRIVLIDSPPLLLTSESRALAHWAGQIVVVVCADITPQKAVIDAVSQLGNEKSVSLVLNQSKDAAPGYYYGSGALTSVQS